MTDASAWAAAADAARRIGHAVEFHATLPSTNDRARALLAEPGGAGVAVVADLQTAGRGRQGRSWVSPPGANLMVSVALRPTLAPARAGLLGIAAAAATLDAARALASAAELRLRWPNDLVTADGLKVAGLLLETTLRDGRLEDAVVGIGMNVNWPRADMPPEIAARATSLAELAGAPVDRVALLGALLAALDRQVARLEAGDGPLDAYRAASALDGREVVVDLGGERLTGVVGGIADDGALLLDTAAGRVALTAGEVVTVRDRPVELAR